MLSSKNIFNDCLNFDDPRFLTKEEFDLENKRTNVKKGDILLTIVGTIGRCCVFLEDEPVVFQRSVAVLKPNVSLVYSRFLMYGIIALNIEKLGRGAAQKGVYLKQLSNISIPLPPLSVQKEIVARLDKLSDNVKRLEANYKQIIANCDELKKSILKKTFEGES
jgi:type I restriction enzyme S subunit